jgi:hypothetical protein
VKLTAGNCRKNRPFSRSEFHSKRIGVEKSERSRRRSAAAWPGK